MEPTCAAVAYGPLAACLRDRGALEAWLARVDLTEADLSTPERRLSFDATCELWRAAVELTADPRIGLHAGTWYDTGRLDIFGHLARARQTIGEGIRLGISVTTLLNEAWSYDVEVHGVEARVIHRPPPGIALAPQMLEYAVSLAVAMYRTVASEQLDPTEVHFTHDVEDDSPHREVFRAPVRFRMSESAIVAPSKLLQRRLRGADASLTHVLDRIVRQLDEQRTARGRTRDQVSELIAQNLHDNPTLKDIASSMKLTERTLRRKLTAENTSFAALLDDVRRRLAIAYLSDGDAAIRSIAERLGYFDPSAFHKAFKRWTGMSPRSFKSQER